MRALFLLTVLIAMPIYAQQASSKSGSANLSADQKQAIRNVLSSQSNVDSRYIDSDNGHFVDELGFSSIPLSNESVILVEYPSSTQGHNSAFWLFDLRSGAPHLIGSPDNKLAGFWEDIILPHTSYGFHDFVLGWGGPPGAQSETTFRYDGHGYRAIRTHKVEFVDK